MYRQRLRQLRASLKKRSLDGFLIPQTDRHQSEELPPSERRLQWLSGFSGSSGLGIVLSARAALFVDGRYTDQAQQEVDPSLYEVHHNERVSIAQWTSQASASRIGYDPWLHTQNALNTLETTFHPLEITLHPLERNPIDSLWRPRPSRAYAPVFSHPLERAGVPSDEKRAAIGKTLSEQTLDCFILTQLDSIAWLLNIRGNDLTYTPVCASFACLKADGSVFWFTHPDHQADKIPLPSAIALKSLNAFPRFLDSLAERNVALDPTTAPAWIENRLKKARAKVRSIDDPCAVPKAVKNPAEIQGMRQAHLRDGIVLTSFLHWLSQIDPSQVTEQDAASYLLTLRQQHPSFHTLSFPTISAAGPHAAIIHYHPTPQSNAPLDSGPLYLCDSGAQYLDGTTDITRTIALSNPSEDHQYHFTHVLKGHIALASARFPQGTRGHQLDTLARRPLWDIGLDYDHGTGHGVGAFLNVHEKPHRFSKTPSSLPLQSGMILSNEPGYYRQGHYGIRLENLVLVTPELSFETLSLAPFDTKLILPSLLTQNERSWLNHYHAKVYRTLAPFLPPPIRSWLAEQELTL